MKKLFCVLFVFNQIIVFGQIDSLLVHRGISPDYSKTIFPHNDGLTYNQFVGETIAGFELASGWRTDSINGGFNKKIHRNPYIESQSDYLFFNKQSFDNSFIFYRYENGRKFNGIINDTLDLTYVPPVIQGILYNNPYYESENIKVIFKANCEEGLVNGKAVLSDLTTNKTLSEAYFEKGEIIGETISTGIYTKNIFSITFEKGNDELINRVETDSEGKSVEIRDPKDEFNFETAYENLANPFRHLSKEERAKQIYLNESNPDFKNPLFLQPIKVTFHYIGYASSKNPLKKFETENFNIEEYAYNELRIVFYHLKYSFSKDYATVIECLDKSNRLLMVRYFNVYSSEIEKLENSKYTDFFTRMGYGNVLGVFKYDEYGNLIKASKYEGVFGNDIYEMCDYKEFTNEIKTLPYSLPVSISETLKTESQEK